MTTSSSSIGLSNGQLNIGTDGGTTTLTGLTTGGINTQALLQALVTAYSVPETQLQSQQTTLQSQISDYQAINTAFATLEAAAEGLATSSGWNASTVTSSNSAVASATAAAGATPGSVSFTVNQLASAGVVASSNQVSSTSTVVATAPLFVSAGAGTIGFSTLASSTASTGSHTIAVTQASSAASTSGAPVAQTITFASDSTLDVTVDGTPTELTIAAGTYSTSQLASTISTQSGGALALTANADGSLSLATTDEGSAASLQITGGSALGQLGLSTTDALTGSDAIVTVDGQATTVNHVVAGQSVTLGAPSGSFTATVAGGHLSAGTVAGQEISVGTGTLAAVVSAINAASVGVTASAVSTGSGYRLLLSGSKTGAGQDPSISAAALTGLGSLSTVNAASNASIQVGGSGGFAVTSTSNSVTGLLPGVSIALSGVSTSAVTLTVGADVTTASSNVAALVTAANSALSAIQTYAGYNSTTQTGGPLMGDTSLSTLTQSVLSAVGNVLGTSTAGGAAGFGVSLNDDGTLSFDPSAFATAYTADPTGVAAAFTQGGTFAPTSSTYANAASLVYAGNGTDAGSYDVVITNSATQGTATGTTVTGGVVPTGGDTLAITVNGVSASYAATAGQSLSDVATGLNAALASAGVALTASVVTNGSDSQLVLTGDQYGAAAGFTVTSSTGALGITSGTYNGSDVAGTINGIAATGAGQYLQASTTDTSLAGMELKITATGITSATDIGTFTYTPALAQQLASVAASATDVSSGSLTSAVTGLQTQNTNLGDQITAYQARVTEETAILTQEFSAMETQLSTLNSSAQFLTQYLASLNKSTS